MGSIPLFQNAEKNNNQNLIVHLFLMHFNSRFWNEKIKKPPQVHQTAAARGTSCCVPSRKRCQTCRGGLMTNSHTFGPTQNEEFTIKNGEEGIHVWQRAEKRRKSDYLLRALINYLCKQYSTKLVKTSTKESILKNADLTKQNPWSGFRQPKSENGLIFVYPLIFSFEKSDHYVASGASQKIWYF